jgi:hypothetical protein
LGANQPYSFGEQNQFRKRLDLQLLHDVLAVPFDRAFGTAKLGSNVSIQLSANNQTEHLALGRGQGIDSGMHCIKPVTSAAILAITRDGLRDSLQQEIGVYRLGQEILGTEFHRQYAARNIAMARYEDNG